MDIQLKRGMLEICVLTVLCRGDSYGYQIVKDVSPYVEISESTLYPILKRLETADALTVYSVEHNSRLRKYYKITDAGRRKISEFLEEWKEVMTVYDYIRREMRGEENE
jgi:PadR family transcriptional regulator PadR